MYTASRLWILALLPAMAAAQESPGLGVPVDTESLAAIDYAVLPDGDGLPAGAGTAVQGERVFSRHCLACHGAGGTGGLNDPLVGGRGSLATDSAVKTVGSYWPYATTVFDYIRRAMPLPAPGTLSDDELYSVTAYLLFLNGIIEESQVLDADALPRVRMPNRDGFVRAWQEE